MGYLKLLVTIENVFEHNKSFLELTSGQISILMFNFKGKSSLDSVRMLPFAVNHEQFEKVDKLGSARTDLCPEKLKFLSSGRFSKGTVSNFTVTFTVFKSLVLKVEALKLGLNERQFMDQVQISN